MLGCCIRMRRLLATAGNVSTPSVTLRSLAGLGATATGCGDGRLRGCPRFCWFCRCRRTSAESPSRYTRTSRRAEPEGAGARPGDRHESGTGVRASGPLLAGDLLAVLSNVAHHAGATSADVYLSAGSEIILRVEDDGRGPGPAREGGRVLKNLEARARAHGGSFALAPKEWRGSLAPAHRPHPALRGERRPSARTPARYTLAVRAEPRCEHGHRQPARTGTAIAHARPNLVSGCLSR